MLGNEGFEHSQIPAHAPGLLVDDFFPVPQGDDAQNLAGCAAADGGVVLVPADFC